MDIESDCSVVMVASAIFFFKQKAAYDMRISDWSSDVCSSDLAAGAADPDRLVRRVEQRRVQVGARHAGQAECVRRSDIGHAVLDRRRRDEDLPCLRSAAVLREKFDALVFEPGEFFRRPALVAASSDERRVGKEWVSTCSSRGSPYH